MAVAGNRVGPLGDLALWVSLVIILLSAGLSLLVALLWTLWRAARCHPAHEHYDYILVPGKRLRHGRPDTDFSSRLATAAQLWQRQRVPVYVSGGCFDGSGTSEAEAGVQQLLAQGVARDSLVAEQLAANSYENFALLANSLRDYRCGAVVSNRYHLPRLGLLAADLQLAIDTVPAETALQLAASSWLRWLQEAFYNHWLLVARLCRTLAAGRP